MAIKKCCIFKGFEEVLDKRTVPLRKKPHKVHDLSCLGNQNTPFTTLLDAIDPDPERIAQRAAYLKRAKGASPKTSSKKPKMPSKPSPKEKVLSFEEKLERTQKWLQEMFSDIFDPAQPCKALDAHIVRDVKAHYKKGQVKNKYPNDLVIKAALYRYMESPEYLACRVKGTSCYNVKGEVVGAV